VEFDRARPGTDAAVGWLFKPGILVTLLVESLLTAVEDGGLMVASVKRAFLPVWTGVSESLGVVKRDASVLTRLPRTGRSAALERAEPGRGAGGGPMGVATVASDSLLDGAREVTSELRA
jgi:hypothetical protein